MAPGRDTRRGKLLDTHVYIYIYAHIQRDTDAGTGMCTGTQSKFANRREKVIMYTSPAMKYTIDENTVAPRFK